MKTIYAIRDRIADDIVGLQMYSLFTFKTDQQAVRYFADTLFDEKSILAKHPQDYELIACGVLHDDGKITTNIDYWPKIITTGEALLAMQQPKLQVEA